MTNTNQQIHSGHNREVQEYTMRTTRVQMHDSNKKKLKTHFGCVETNRIRPLPHSTNDRNYIILAANCMTMARCSSIYIDTSLSSIKVEYSCCI